MGWAAMAIPAWATCDLTVHLAVPPETPPDSIVQLELRGQYSREGSSSTTFEETRPMRKAADGRYAASISWPSEVQIEFRFLRGPQRDPECGPHGEISKWRRLRVGRSLDLDLKVARWCSLGPRRTMTASVTEHQLESFLGGRRVWVYLPPSYATSERSYPVLYMLDGQNLFDDTTSFVGEWHVDESCDELIREGEIAELIVVGVDNAAEQRIEEYTPWPDASMRRGGEGEVFLNSLITELMPWVEKEYRVQLGAATTGFAGSSLGGLMALYVAQHHADTFLRVAALSPSLWWDDGRILEKWDSPPAGLRLWADMGSREGGRTALGSAEVGDAVGRLRTLKDRLVAAGYEPGSQLRVVEVEGAEHNEGAWSARLPQILRFLYPAPVKGEP